ncbi:MAG: glycosyltransferase family 4 protein [Lachnospiraceae bacterium]|nr:glycosyltransferase family 4 protein [Lachnospiraceae bacterium]
MSRVLIINPILYTAETNQIPKVKSIKDTMIYTLCLGFLEKGHEVTLLAAQDYKPTEEEKYHFPVIWMETIWHKLFMPRCFPYMPRLRGYLKQHPEYDLIISSEMFSTWSYTATRICPEKTIIWHELAKHNNMMHQIPSKVWYHIVARLFMQKALVVPRSEAAETFIGAFSKNVSATIIDHGVNMTKLNGMLGVAHDNSVKNQFVVVSQLIERKRIDKTIQTFDAFYKKGYSDYKLYIIGQGELEEELRQLVKMRQLENAVIFCGKMNHEQLLPMVADSKALLVSTSKDNNMVSITESIAAGTPVITTSVPYNAAYIAKEKLGIVADGWGVEALEEICEKSIMYVENCVKYRDKLSNTFCAEQFIVCHKERGMNHRKK